ncbi:MAG: lipoyl synthase [Euryarchaeota archaeon]|nr:lipoyl synthase [Euryarchaeota archaeon]
MQGSAEQGAGQSYDTGEEDIQLIMSKHLPEWLRAETPTGELLKGVQTEVQASNIQMACLLSRCPNQKECLSRGQAAFILLGITCTRRCAFCAVGTGAPNSGADPDEPVRVAKAVTHLGLEHVVLTSVTRDDLPDQGAGQFTVTVKLIRKWVPTARVEITIPDMQGREDLLAILASSRPDVLGHNLETVRRLQPMIRDRRAGYQRSLEVLRMVKRLDRDILTKSSLLLGLGETREEVSETLHDLHGAGVEALSIGQYLRPKGGRLAVARYVRPEEFKDIGMEALAAGFRYVASGPLVRSSYWTGSAFEKLKDVGR